MSYSATQRTTQPTMHDRHGIRSGVLDARRTWPNFIPMPSRISVVSPAMDDGSSSPPAPREGLLGEPRSSRRSGPSGPSGPSDGYSGSMQARCAAGRAVLVEPGDVEAQDGREVLAAVLVSGHPHL